MGEGSNGLAATDIMVPGAPEVMASNQQPIGFQEVVDELRAIKETLEKQRQPLNIRQRLVASGLVIGMAFGGWVAGVEYARSRFISAANVISTVILSEAVKEGKPAACSLAGDFPVSSLPKNIRQFCDIKEDPSK
jgi:hypothetical protein